MKFVLITGASSGIGQATAHTFHKNGYFVYLLARDKTKLTQVHNALPNSQMISCDLADPKQIQNLPQAIDLTKLNVLVNNAGIYFSKAADDYSGEDWFKMFQVNLFSAAQICSMVLPGFKLRKKGAIVNVSSTLGHKPVPKTAIYSASKAALQSFTKTLALESAPFGIRVNCVAPGIVETPIHKLDSLPHHEKIESVKKMNSYQPLGRMGQPADIAEMIYFLSSDVSSWTTGAIFDVDGGINIL